MLPNASEISCHALQHNQPHNGHISFADSRPQQEFAGTVLPDPLPDKFYKARLNDFTRDICGDLADRWIGLFEPQLNYYGETPVWWPEGITLMSPRRMLKDGKTSFTLSTFKANGAKTESCFSNT